MGICFFSYFLFINCFVQRVVGEVEPPRRGLVRATLNHARLQSRRCSCSCEQCTRISHRCAASQRAAVPDSVAVERSTHATTRRKRRCGIAAARAARRSDLFHWRFNDPAPVARSLPRCCSRRNATRLHVPRCRQAHRSKGKRWRRALSVRSCALDEQLRNAVVRDSAAAAASRIVGRKTSSHAVEDNDCAHVPRCVAARR